MLHTTLLQKKILGALVAALLAILASHNEGGPSVTELSATREPPPHTEGGAMLYVEPDDGRAFLSDRVAGATSTIDVVMYSFKDDNLMKELIQAHERGVVVRVILNSGYYGAGNKANLHAFQYLSAHGVLVHWSPKYFALTHEKSFTFDGRETCVLTFNATPKYYSTGRDFALCEPGGIVNEMEQLFEDDWDSESKTESLSSLVASPRSQKDFIAFIDGATKTLEVYNEELADKKSIAALSRAARRGVHVRLIMTDQDSWHTGFQTLINAGASIHIYSPRDPLYIHAKVMIRDGNLTLMGSQNFSLNSLERNREVSVFIDSVPLILRLETIFEGDWTASKNVVVR